MTVTLLPLDQITVDPDHNPRTGALEGIAELAVSIQAIGLLQPIVVRLLPHPPGIYQVVAGHRRLAAIQSLGWTDVSVTVVNETTSSIEAALTENVMRQAMHPADEYAAFARLKKDGLKEAGIARHFGLTEKQVKQRLALGSMIPELLALYRQNRIEDKGAMYACQMTKAQQKKMFADALADATEEGGEDDAATFILDTYTIRDWLDDKVIRPTHPDVAFIGGLSVYVDAGGKVEEDLFGDDKRIKDTKLLASLVATAKQEAIDAAKSEGWDDVLWRGENGPEGYFYQYAQQKAGPGKILVLDKNWDGELTRSYLVKREEVDTTRDEVTGYRPREQYQPTRDYQPVAPVEPDLSAHLSRDLSKILTQACQNALAENANAALNLLAAQMVMKACKVGRSGYPLMIQTWVRGEGQSVSAPDFPDINDFVGVLRYFQAQPLQRSIDAIAAAVPAFLDMQDDRALSWTQDGNASARVRHAVVDLALPTDYARHLFKPDAEYFGKLKTQQIIDVCLEILEHTKPKRTGQKKWTDAYDYMKGMNWLNSKGSPNGKKTEWVERAVKLAAESRWLPQVLRDRLYDGPGKAWAMPEAVAHDPETGEIDEDEADVEEATGLIEPIDGLPKVKFSTELNDEEPPAGEDLEPLSVEAEPYKPGVGYVGMPPIPESLRRRKKKEAA